MRLETTFDSILEILVSKARQKEIKICKYDKEKNITVTIYT